MPANKRSTAGAWVDPDDAPDLSAPEWRAKLDAVVVRRGRPPSDSPKVSTTIRLDADIVAKFRAKGAGWQSRMNTALREWLESKGRAERRKARSAGSGK